MNQARTCDVFYKTTDNTDDTDAIKYKEQSTRYIVQRGVRNVSFVLCTLFFSMMIFRTSDESRTTVRCCNKTTNCTNL